MRDSTATVTAYGDGMKKSLLVNGYGMTTLTPVTKMIAHLALAALPSPPRNVLVVCFGMGSTTYFRDPRARLLTHKVAMLRIYFGPTRRRTALAQPAERERREVERRGSQPAGRVYQWGLDTFHRSQRVASFA